MKPIKQLKFLINSDLNALGDVLATFESLKMDFIPQQDWLESQLALAEAFTNAVRHAHRDLGADTGIEISIQVFQDYLEICVWDYGEEFDFNGLLAKIAQMDEGSPSNGDAIGQRGLIILSKVSDCISYERIDRDRNCLYIKKIYRFN